VRPDVSVVIPVRNAARYLERSLPAVLDQDYAGTYEVVVVDNGSTDGSQQLVARFPRATMLVETKRGAYAARNRGAEAALAPLVVFTDPDCVPRPDWLSLLTAPLADPEVVVVLGRSRGAGRTRLSRLLADYGDAKNAYIFGADDDSLVYGYTNNMATRREALLAQGGFVERLRGADCIFVRRVMRDRPSSAIRYEPHAAVAHLEVDSVGGQLRKCFVYGRSRRLVEPIERVRPLTSRERLHVFRRAAAGSTRSPAEAILLFGVLSVGALFWYAGALSARLLPREQWAS
jgi:mycofactocin glycosyltransferase